MNIEKTVPIFAVLVASMLLFGCVDQTTVEQEQFVQEPLDTTAPQQEQTYEQNEDETSDLQTDPYGCYMLDGDMKEGCYVEVVKDTGEGQYCEMIEHNQDYKNACLAFAELDPIHCTQIASDWDQYMCVNEIVERTGDTSACQLLEDEDYQRMCMN